MAGLFEAGETGLAEPGYTRAAASIALAMLQSPSESFARFFFAPVAQPQRHSAAWRPDVLRILDLGRPRGNSGGHLHYFRSTYA